MLSLGILKNALVTVWLCLHLTCLICCMDITKELEDLKTTLESHAELIAHQQQHIDAIGEKINHLEAGDQVVFSAYLKGNTGNKAYPKAFAQVNFTGVMVNQGNSYSPETSKFTCPTDGLYYFSLSLQSLAMQPGTSHFISSGTLMVEHHQKAEVYVQNGIEEGILYLGGSNSVITECKRGEKVKVMSLQPGNGMLGSRSDMRSTLVGFRLVNTEKLASGQSQKTCDA